MLGADLADLYQVEPRVLVQAVKRNIARFPGDFMFQLTEEEYSNLKSQIVISSWGGPRRASPALMSPWPPSASPRGEPSARQALQRILESAHGLLYDLQQMM